MSENDQELIYQARLTHYVNHFDIDKLIEQASASEVKKELRRIQRSKEHLEEYKSACN